MRTLFPPLENNSAQAKSSMKDGNDDVLSQELRDNFSAMRAIIEQESNEKKRKDASSTTTVKDLQQKKYRVAVSTALAVEDELSRLRNGIAELEALLAQQEGGEFHVFPSLPAIVPCDDGRGFEGEDADKFDGKMVHG
jgi:hypothetical protein